MKISKFIECLPKDMTRSYKKNAQVVKILRYFNSYTIVTCKIVITYTQSPSVYDEQ